MLHHAWQIYDSTTEELTSQLTLLWPCREQERPCKLLDLIQQELAERGDADTVLQAMTSLDRHASAPEAMLHHTAVADRSLSATDAAAPAEQAGLPVVHIAPEPKSVGKLQAVAATSLIDIHTTQLSDSAHASPKADPADDACRTGDSVLAAAMAAYRQEKRQLWKARKAGSAAGWRFAAHDIAQSKSDTKAPANPRPALVLDPGGTVAHQYSTLGGYPCFDRQPDLQAVSNVHRPAALPNTESHTASMPSVITSEVSIPRPTAAHKPGVDVQRPLSAVHKVHNQGDDYAREAAEGYSVGNASHRQQAVRLQHRQQPSSSIETADQTDMESCQSIPARLSAARAAQDASVSQHEDQLGRDELFQGSANMQQGDIGVQQGNTGLQQSSVGLRQGSTGQQQDNTGLQQDNIGLQQGSTGPQQGSTGLQQGNAGLQYGSTGPQQGSTGLSQGNTSWQQGITGLQQGNIDLWPNLRACSEHAGTSRSYTMPAASKIQQDAGQANARCCSLEQACSVQNSGSQADPVPAGTSKTHGAECHSLDSVSLQPVKSQPKSASADTSSSKQWSQPCSGEMHSIHQSGKPEDCCSAADAYELLQAHQLQVTPQPTCGEDNRSDMHSASSTAFHMQQKLWCTGRALSAASSASDSEEGTPTPSGRDSILETQQQWCLPSGTQHDNDADALGQHQNGADSQLINASHVLCSSEVEIKAMWRCPQQQEPSEKKQSASGLYSRAPDWNVETDDGLCSWPSTPLHDLGSAGLQDCNYIKHARHTRYEGVLNSRHATNKLTGLPCAAEKSESIFQWEQGECLVLSNN